MGFLSKPKTPNDVSTNPNKNGNRQFPSFWVTSTEMGTLKLHPIIGPGELGRILALTFLSKARPSGICSKSGKAFPPATFLQYRGETNLQQQQQMSKEKINRNRETTGQ